MLLNVHLTPRVISETSHSQAQYAAPALRREIRDLLLRHGVLRFSSGEEAKQVLDALKDPNLTQQEATEWKQMVMTLHGAGRLQAENPALADKLEDADSLADLDPLKSLQPLLSVLPPATYARLFPEAQSGLSRLAAQFEAGVPGSLTESAQYAKVQRLVELGRFPKGANRDRVWQELLEPFARVSNHVYIFDKYLFAALADTSDEQMNWLLPGLDKAMPSGSAVTLIAARGIPGDRGEEKVSSFPREAEYMLRDYLPDKYPNLSSVQVLLAPSVRQRDMHHDRHIRFSAGAAFELPSGFGPLGYRQLRDNFGFTHRYSPATLKELQEREEAVRRNRDVHSFDLV